VIAKKRIFVNGSFDVLHLGHLRLLNYARSLGDHLCIAIDTDRRIRELKGDNRPINNLHERKTMLANLRCVDEVLVFDSDQDLIHILQAYKPDVIVKGSDHRETSQLSKQYCKEVIFYERFGGYSSTKKIQNIVGR
jgi:D-beta-D-heptose 7-phosphate kinase/D-beta-D-heptose 1-phosphate adenosyltransferase